jgi:ubiquinone/menaquinone biosynthesis C-methylase UbiE
MKMMQENIHALTSVDQAVDPNSLVRFLETAAGYFGPLNARSFALLRVASGSSVLDVGCGMGNDVASLATLVGRDGQVVGLDSSKAMIAEAVRRTSNSNLPVKFQLGDAEKLAFADAAFDAVRSSRLLCHLQEPRLALTEMIRVLRPGGHLVIIEPDHDTLVIAAPQRETTRKIVSHFSDGFRHGRTGRWLPVWCRELGLIDIQVEPYTIQMDYEFVLDGLRLDETVRRVQEAGTVTAEEASAWMNWQKQAAVAGLFYSALTFFMVCGRKRG